MRLEIKDEHLLIWETNRRDNKIIYNSNNDINTYTRRDLYKFQKFLKQNDQSLEADKIKSHLGKIISIESVPQLIPTGTYRVNKPIQYLKSDIKKFVDEYELQLNPDFQRGHVWNLMQRIKFVEFLLQGGKTNPIYFNNPNWMRTASKTYTDFVIVDGKQRLTSLLMFLDNEFTVFKELDEEGVGYYAKDFDTFGVIDVIFVVNDLTSKNQVLEWYLQMNEGNVAHTEEELNKVRELIEK